VLSDQLVVRVARPWTPGAKYAVILRGLRNVTGVTADAVGTLVVPERAAADSLAPGDSLRRRPDSLRRALPKGVRPAKPGKPSKPAPTRTP
jgi:hypothetical protein